MHATRVPLRTFLLLLLFATTINAASVEHAKARRAMAEAEQTSNPIRLLMLSIDIRKSLDLALEEDPENVEVRLDLVRYHVMTPRIAGGDMDEARVQAEEIAKRDAALGHFARGYIAYREKQFGIGRRELRESMRLATKPATRTLAAKWLGWLSQESQQYADAFAIWEELKATDPSALYEIVRTASFCSCELEKGRAALREYLQLRPRDAEARKLSKKLHHR